MAIGYIPHELMVDARAKGNHLLVYAALESFCDKDQRECWPARETLAARARLHPSTASRALADLIRWKYVDRMRWTNGNLKSRNRYRLRCASGAHRKTQEGKTNVLLGDHGTSPESTNNVLSEHVVKRRRPFKASEGLNPPIPPAGGKPRKRGKTISVNPPSVEEIAEVMTDYATHKALRVDVADAAEEMHLHYTANGWRVGGKTPMKDWRAAAQGWLRKGMQWGKPWANSKPKPDAQDKMMAGDDDYWLGRGR